MKNSITHITNKEFCKLKSEMVNQDKICLVEMNGKLLKKIDDYFSFIEKELRFPTPIESISDRYLDWIRDLTWLKYEKYVFVIFNYEAFLSEDLDGREYFYNTFENYIIPWWEEDVLHYMVGGKQKKFELYLICNE